MKIEALTRDEVRSVIKGEAKTRRVPVYVHIWVHTETFGDREPAVKEILSRYPQDVQLVSFVMPWVFQGPNDRPDYKWLPYDDPYIGRTVAIDEQIALPDWNDLDSILARFPDPEYPNLFKGAEAPPDGRYRLAHWWFCLFERHWSLRGMTNALLDYYEHPAETHRLFRALTDFYLRIIERAKKEKGCDGIWTSDDLGTQTSTFFSVKIFREFFKPYYTEIAQKIHDLGMDFWMHACGYVEPFIPEWIEAGLDVLHPIQKHTMDEKKIAGKYGDRLTIFSGLDVQRVIPWGTPQEVRAEVRYLMDTFWRPGKGRCMITAGNGINQDCTLESLEAFLDEAVRYGAQVALR